MIPTAKVFAVMVQLSFHSLMYTEFAWMPALIKDKSKKKKKVEENRPIPKVISEQLKFTTVVLSSPNTYFCKVVMK